MDDVIDIFTGHIDGADGWHNVVRQCQPVCVDVCQHHIACPCVPRHSCGHDPDGASASDQHIFAQKIKAERCMHSIAQRV